MSPAIPKPETASGTLADNRKREDLFAIYNPANAVERMLVQQIEQARERLDRANDLERRYFASRDMVEVLNTKLVEFKAVTRYVTDCERAWRHAMQALEKTQRQRLRESAPRTPVRVSSPPPKPKCDPVPQPAVAAPAPALAASAHSRRE